MYCAYVQARHVMLEPGHLESHNRCIAPEQVLCPVPVVVDPVLHGLQVAFAPPGEMKPCRQAVHGEAP
jgi:hypothetical protein